VLHHHCWEYCHVFKNVISFSWSCHLSQHTDSE